MEYDIKEFIVRCQRDRYTKPIKEIIHPFRNGYKFATKQNGYEFLDLQWGNILTTGQTVVFVDGVPIWYFQRQGGFISEHISNEAILSHTEFLYEQMRKVSLEWDIPIRGPLGTTKKVGNVTRKYRKTLSVNSTLHKFTGRDSIIVGTKAIHYMNFRGGLIVQR